MTQTAMADGVATSFNMKKKDAVALAKAALADSVATSFNMNKADVYKVIVAMKMKAAAEASTKTAMADGIATSLNMQKHDVAKLIGALVSVGWPLHDQDDEEASQGHCEGVR